MHTFVFLLIHTCTHTHTLRNRGKLGNQLFRRETLLRSQHGCKEISRTERREWRLNKLAQHQNVRAKRPVIYIWNTPGILMNERQTCAVDLLTRQENIRKAGPTASCGFIVDENPSAIRQFQDVCQSNIPEQKMLGKLEYLSTTNRWQTPLECIYERLVQTSVRKLFSSGQVAGGGAM